MNDVEMLQTVGHPFRMANANPKLHVLLPHTGQAGHHDESGVARQIRQALGMA
jgi:hydroxymethylpyrimidine pyrophosphatase-like HAD family hydrolase